MRFPIEFSYYFKDLRHLRYQREVEGPQISQMTQIDLCFFELNFSCKSLF